MKTKIFPHYLLLAIMVLATYLAIALKPTQYAVSQDFVFNFEDNIPASFGDWVAEDQESGAIVNPQQQELIQKVYSQTYAKTYRHTSGRRIMLSLAYGRDQSHETQIHKPEVCYPAQGFIIKQKYKDEVQLGSSRLPVMRLTAVAGHRSEPITYWIRVGDDLARGSVEQNLSRIRSGLAGIIPDGILFRVSEINSDPNQSFTLQDEFIKDLLVNLNDKGKTMLVGTHSTN